MNHNSFRTLSKTISVGKKLPGAIYLHKSATSAIPVKLLEFIENIISTLNLQKVDWNLIKINPKNYSFSLLNYPEFYSDPYPALHTSYTINLRDITYRKASYINSDNPPILHRKELFILPTDPAFEEFKSLTEAGEAAGYYENSRKIGFKKNWEEIINSKTQTSQPSSTETTHKTEQVIERHKTAIDRTSLSSPMQALYRNNYLSGNFTVLDYGCGKGDDVAILKNNQVEITGYDPIYYPEVKLGKADIVNLGFVINVIENPEEREKTLKKAFSLTRKVMSVSVMLGGSEKIQKFERYGDGVITSRNTFQKYYSQTEFRDLLDNTLPVTPIAVGPGVFFIFKDQIEEQTFLINRQRSKANWIRLSYSERPDRLQIKQKALYERHKELFNSFWEQCLEYGRIPTNSEFDQSEELRSLCSSHKRAFLLLTTIYQEEYFTDSAQRRKDDLLVYYALSLFGKRKVYKRFPHRLQLDVKYFFGNYTTALQEATELLFSVGDPALINDYCCQAYQNLGRGKLEDNHSLTIHRADVESLPAPLRVYIGCATQLYGDIESVDLVKIHIRSGKVSLMRYDDFENVPLPLLKERIKIKLRDQEIDFFYYGDEYEPQPLYLKSIYLASEAINYAEQKRFDDELRNLPGMYFENFGMSNEELKNHLQSEGVTVKGFKLQRK